VTGVVDLGVVVLQRTDEGVLAQRWRDGPRSPPRQVAVERHACAVARRLAHGVVQGDAGTGVEPLPAAVLQRVEERDLANQVRRQPLQVQAPLLECLGDEPEVEHLEVAQPTVHELARAAGRAGGQVTRLHQPDRQATGGGVEGRSSPDDATPDHQDVESRGGHRLECVLAGLRGQGC
jgi:hypothetical protein